MIEQDRERITESKKRVRFVMGTGQGSSLPLLMWPSQIAPYQITDNHLGQGIMKAVTAHQSRLLPVLKTLVNNSTG